MEHQDVEDENRDRFKKGTHGQTRRNIGTLGRSPRAALQFRG